MAWIISNALMQDYENSRCSLARGAEFLEVTCSDGKQSAQPSGTNTPLLYCAQDKMKGFSRISRYGMTCRPLTAGYGEDLSTWYLAASRAKTYPALAVVPESKEIGQACGNTWRESLAKYDLDSHSWKTAQCSPAEGLGLFSGTWPRSGTMLHGAAYRARSLEPTTKETASGLLLPTPTCHNAKEGAYPAEYTRRTPTLATHVGGKIHPRFTEWMMAWPSGWTDLKPLETGKFQQWQQAHSFS